MYSKHVVRFFNQLQVNWVIKLLILSDFLIWSAQQFFVPVFAIFLTEQIHGATIEVIGITTAIYLIVRSIFEIPVGMWLDRTKAEVDDLYAAFLGTVLTALVFLSYNFITEVWQLYIAQMLWGVGSAVAFPGWYAIFTKHIDKNKEALEWSLYDVVLGIGMAATAAVGGFLATEYGFKAIFIIAAASTLLGAFLLLSLRDKICRRESQC